MNALPLFNIAIGCLLLITGRRLFWVFVGVAGFLAGTDMATTWWSTEPAWAVLAFSVLLGLIGALVALAVPRLVAGLAGFLAGGWLATVAFPGLQPAWLAATAYVTGGVIVALVMLALLDWALIALSTLMGAAMIVQNFNVDPTVNKILFIALALLGVALQFRQLELGSRPSRQQHEPG